MCIHTFLTIVPDTPEVKVVPHEIDCNTDMYGVHLHVVIDITVHHACMLSLCMLFGFRLYGKCIYRTPSTFLKGLMDLQPPTPSLTLTQPLVAAVA